MTIKRDKCLCPYCGYSISYNRPFCKICEIELVICEKCNQVLRKDVKICPHCGFKKEDEGEEILN
jgi:RNA polymerase subunit RPABC4/transcription elongation factor Spt4